MSDLFNWDPMTSCGDEEGSDTCEALETTFSVKSLRGTAQSDNCEIDLISQQYPALVSMIGDSKTDARSGSAAHPIPLNKVQTYGGATVPELFFRNSAGQLAAWNPPLECDNQKVVIESGAFTWTPDINSNVFSESCIGSIDDVDYIAGGKTFTDCNGVTRMKLVFFLKESICDYCDELES